MKENRLIYELNWNCRQTHTELAKKLRVSKQVIAYKIKQLEKKGIIKGYHALIDWRKLGYNATRIYIKWRNISPEVEEEIYKEIKQNPLFMWSVKFEGDIDLAFYVGVKSISKLEEKWNIFLKKYKKYILKYEIYELVNMVHYPMKLLHNKIEEKIVGNGEKVDYDDKDYKILKAITENAQIHIVDLAKKIKLTPKAALYRLKNLEKKGIVLGYNALIDTDKLGYRFYKIDYYLNDISKLNTLNQFAKQHKNIVYRMKTIGGPDFEIEVMVKDVVEMREIINEIREKFSDYIETYRFHRFEYTIKQIYLPSK